MAFAQQNKGLFKFESYESVSHYLNVEQLEYDINDLYVFKTFDEFWKFNTSGFLSGPVIHVFNSDGLYLDLIKSDEVMEKLSDFGNIQKKPKKNALHISSWFNGLINLKTQESIIKEDGASLYFVLNWAVFFNQPEKIELLFKWYDVLKRQQASGKNIQIVLLDMDLQEFWDLSEEKKQDMLKQFNQ